jgi:hypothetical protein
MLNVRVGVAALATFTGILITPAAAMAADVNGSTGVRGEAVQGSVGTPADRGALVPAGSQIACDPYRNPYCARGGRR